MKVLTFTLLAISLSIEALASPVGLAKRTANSICGFWYDSVGSSLYEFSCPTSVPCAVAEYLTPAYAFCSPSGEAPITQVFGYEEGPAGGCGVGQLCCNASPSGAGTFTYNSGLTSLLFCGHTKEIIAMATVTSTGLTQFSVSLVTAAPPTVPTTSSVALTTVTVTPTQVEISTTSSPTITTPTLDSTSTTSSTPTSTATQSSWSDKLNTGSEIGSIVGAIAGVISVFLTVKYAPRGVKKLKDYWGTPVVG